MLSSIDLAFASNDIIFVRTRDRIVSDLKPCFLIAEKISKAYFNISKKIHLKK